MKQRIVKALTLFALLVWADATTEYLGAQAAPGNFVIPNDVPSLNPSIIRSKPDYIDARVLAANVAEVWTAPANVRFVIFSGNCDFYARPNAAAAVPAADVTDGTASELNPAAWYFANPVTTIGVIAPTVCIVTISAYLGRVQ